MCGSPITHTAPEIHPDRCEQNDRTELVRQLVNVAREALTEVLDDGLDFRTAFGEEHRDLMHALHTFTCTGEQLQEVCVRVRFVLHLWVFPHGIV